MANKEQLELLRQDGYTWNEWRKLNPSIRLDFRDADLKDACLSGIDLTGADLSGAVLHGASLRGAKLTGGNLRGAVLWRAALRLADLSRADLRDSTLIAADVSEADLNSANLSNADLSHANLRGACLARADLCGANLSETNLRGADLQATTLNGANLSAATLRAAKLNGADLGSANLSAAYMRSTNLSGASLHGARLAHAMFHDADLGTADLASARLIETVFTDVDLSGTKGLATCRHFGPSSMDYRTLSRSGRLPLSFLRGCGFPDAYIEYLPTLFGEPTQYYSCFVSHSSRDAEFAEHLHEDLQDRGVRCWFAPEDMRIGDKILDTIDQAIRLRDKILLILSQESIASDWVEDEVTAGFEEERKRSQVVLFPVRLDDAVMDSKEAWAAKLRARHTGDFRDWKSPDAYQRAFERLLRDLRRQHPESADGGDSAS